MRRICVKGRYLYWDTGDPFFYLGDTAWELIHRLTREEVERYMETRARQGFTAVQMVALAELDGLNAPNAYGRTPLMENPDTKLYDPTRPDVSGEYDYWQHTDFVIDCAQRHGLIAVLLPTWGDKFCPLWSSCKMIFTPENAYIYGKWIAERYAKRENLIWMLGGDRPLDERTRPIIDQMARGIREMDENHLITFHPAGGHRSTEYLANADYIDFHTSQTGHDVAKCYDSDGEMRRMSLESEKPYMDSEPRYEDHPACFNPKLGLFWSQTEVRQNAYWDVFAGACGHTFGNHNIWCMNTEPREYFPYLWRDALTHPAAEQMRHLARLRMRGDYASFRPAPEAVDAEWAGAGHIAAALGNGYLYAYSPLGLPFTVDLTRVAAPDNVLRALWFDPRTGSETLFGIYPTHGRSTFVPPTCGQGEDWVLILEKGR